MHIAADRYDNYFRRGCRVRDIYSEKYGTVIGLSVGKFTTAISVQFDGEDTPVPVRSICLEVIGAQSAA